MSKISIACYECGEETKVPAMGKNQTHQICQSCKEERRKGWQELQEKSKDQK
jgi:NMD protein affecting ribosome stability and mRNA decay